MPKPIIVILDCPTITRDEHGRYCGCAEMWGVAYYGAPATTIDGARANALREVERELGQEYRVIHSLFAE